MGKSLSNKYGQKLLDSAKKSTTDSIRTTSKRAIQETAEATGDLMANKIADKILSVSEKPANSLELSNDETKEEVVEIATPKTKYISPEERKQTVEELRLVPKRYV